MLQLQHLKLLQELTGVKPYEIRPVKFGRNAAYVGAGTLTLATQFVPDNQALVVLRIQSYLVNSDETASDYAFYRAVPPGVAYWVLQNVNDTLTINNLVNWTNPLAPSALLLDTDDLTIFPATYYAALTYDPDAAPPATGTWEIQTTCYGYLIPPKAVSALSGNQAWSGNNL